MNRGDPMTDDENEWPDAYIVEHSVHDSGMPTVTVSCPYCRRTHRHTWDGADDDGIRVSHCHNGEYVITDEPCHPLELANQPKKGTQK